MDPPAPQMHFIDVSPIISSKRLSRWLHSPDTYCFHRQTRTSIPFPRQRRNASYLSASLCPGPGLRERLLENIPRFFSYGGTCGATLATRKEEDWRQWTSERCNFEMSIPLASPTVSACLEPSRRFLKLRPVTRLSRYLPRETVLDF